MKILILNGPNINLIGTREPHIYGTVSFLDYFSQLRSRYADHDLTTMQSNHEGALIDILQDAPRIYDAVVFNPAAYSHTSIALADCIHAIEIPVVEVHISDITKREAFRHRSFTGDASEARFYGYGMESYAMAIDYLISRNP